MDLQTYLVVLRRWWTTLLAAALIAGIAGFIGASSAPPVYEAEARLLVGPVSSDINTIRAASALSETYAQLVTSDEVLGGVRDELGLSTPAVLLAESIRATADGTTRLLIIRVRADDADTAAAIANQVPAELIALQSGEVVREEGRLTVVEAAAPPEIPAEPNVPLLTFMAAAVGIMVATLLVLGVEYLNNTFTTRYDLQRTAEAAFLGSVAIPRGFRPTPSEPLIVEAFPDSRAAASFRLLASKISANSDVTSVGSILFVGCQPGDGTGELTANVAAVLSRAGRSVTLIDADDVDGQISRLLSVEERPGVRELLEVPERAGMRTMLGAVTTRRPPGLNVVSRGGSQSNLVDIERARDLVVAAADAGDIVIVTAAPVHRSGSALVWARATDATVVIAQRDVTKRENLVHALDGLRFVGANLLGVAMLERPWSRTYRSTTRRRAPASIMSGSADGAADSARADRSASQPDA